jgi:hypothetical protein
MSFFVFYKIRELGRLVPVGGGKWGKGCERVNTVQILCTCVVKRKMRTVETIPGMRGDEDKGEWG